MSVDVVRQEVDEGVGLILTSSGNSEKEKAAFNAFRKAVLHVSGSRDLPPEGFLNDVVDKDRIMQFLSDFYGSKKMYRKQIIAVWQILLEVDSWLWELLRNGSLTEGLEEDLAEIFLQVKAARPLTEAPPGASTRAEAPAPPPMPSLAAGDAGLQALLAEARKRQEEEEAAASAAAAPASTEALAAEGQPRRAYTLTEAPAATAAEVPVEAPAEAPAEAAAEAPAEAPAATPVTEAPPASDAPPVASAVSSSLAYSAVSSPPVASAVSSQAAKHIAFVFIKPHALTEKVKVVVQNALREKGISIVQESQIDGTAIAKGMLIDKHYYSIASKAILRTPDQLNVPPDKFKTKFEADWEEVLRSGKALNAKEACDKFACSGDQLDEMWLGAKKADKVLKLGGGFYVAVINDYYVFNGFYMSMRSKFVAPGSAIYYYVVEWDTLKLSWADFRGTVLGPTDPAKAPADSIRGMILSDWKNLGLSAEPNQGDNGVHGSASPFEGLAERMNWLGYTAESDAYGQQLIAAGVSEETIDEWKKDPQVSYTGDGEEIRGSLFDVLEDTDAERCTLICHKLAGAGPSVKAVSPPSVASAVSSPPVASAVSSQGYPTGAGVASVRLAPPPADSAPVSSIRAMWQERERAATSDSAAAADPPGTTDSAAAAPEDPPTRSVFNLMRMFESKTPAGPSAAPSRPSAAPDEAKKAEEAEAALKAKEEEERQAREAAEAEAKEAEEEEERKRQKIEDFRRAREEEARRAKEEEERLAREQEEERRAKEEEARRAKEEEERLAREQDEERRAKEEEERRAREEARIKAAQEEQARRDAEVERKYAEWCKAEEERKAREAAERAAIVIEPARPEDFMRKTSVWSSKPADTVEEAAPEEPPGPPPPPPGSAPPSATAVRRVVADAWASMEGRPAAGGDGLGKIAEDDGPSFAAGGGGGYTLFPAAADFARHVSNFQEAANQMQELGFSAERRDPSSDAFNKFYKAVLKTASSESKEDDQELDRLEPKADILAFLIDLQTRRSTQKSRVGAVLQRLETFDSWRTAIGMHRDPAMSRTVRDLVTMDGDRASGASPPVAGVRVASAPSEPPVFHSAREPASDMPSRAAPVAPVDPPRKKWVVWYSIDPRKGEQQFYSTEVMALLENARRRGENGVDITSFMPCSMKVQLEPRLLQMTRGGTRDVIREELDTPEDVATCYVYKNKYGSWQAGSRDGPGSEMRTVNVPRGKAVPLQA